MTISAIYSYFKSFFSFWSCFFHYTSFHLLWKLSSADCNFYYAIYSVYIIYGCPNLDKLLMNCNGNIWHTKEQQWSHGLPRTLARTSPQRSPSWQHGTTTWQPQSCIPLGLVERSGCSSQYYSHQSSSWPLSASSGLSIFSSRSGTRESRTAFGRTEMKCDVLCALRLTSETDSPMRLTPHLPELRRWACFFSPHRNF